MDSYATVRQAPLATVTPRRTDLEKLRQLQLELLQTERNYVEILSFLQEVGPAET